MLQKHAAVNSTASVMGFVHVIQAFLPHLKSHGEGGHSIGVSAICCSFVRTRLIESSARNRPERYGSRTEFPTAAAAQLSALIRSGLDPDEVGERIVRAIQENEFYIFMNPELRSALEARFERIMAAYPKS
jgi:hypothetical protein